jgi:hypothetical protein
MLQLVVTAGIQTRTVSLLVLYLVEVKPPAVRSR